VASAVTVAFPAALDSSHEAVRLMGGQIGAEITGIDVKTMDDTTWRRVY
jgi:hypothetical protein